jgi:hypothetical protein
MAAGGIGHCPTPSGPPSIFRRVRQMFVIYLALIVVGLTYFIYIGLSHH